MTRTPAEAVVIGASAGALEALSIVLPPLSASFGLPIIIVVHVPGDKKSVLSELFQAKCSLNVCEVEDKDPLIGGTVYFAPPDYHVLVEQDKILSLSNDEPVLYSRPSVDVLFESAADAFGPNLVGIILTGASHDGASGLKAVGDAGGVAIVQRPDTAFAAAMPEAALVACPKAQVLSLEEIALYLQELAKV